MWTIQQEITDFNARNYFACLSSKKCRILVGIDRTKGKDKNLLGIYGIFFSKISTEFLENKTNDSKKKKMCFEIWDCQWNSSLEHI